MAEGGEHVNTFLMGIGPCLKNSKQIYQAGRTLIGYVVLICDV